MGDISCQTCDKVLSRNLFHFSCANCSAVLPKLQDVLDHFSDFNAATLKCVPPGEDDKFKRERVEEDTGIPSEFELKCPNCKDVVDQRYFGQHIAGNDKFVFSNPDI